jgi:hypothetical protein
VLQCSYEILIEKEKQRKDSCMLFSLLARIKHDNICLFVAWRMLSLSGIRGQMFSTFWGRISIFAVGRQLMETVRDSFRSNRRVLSTQL